MISYALLFAAIQQAVSGPLSLDDALNIAAHNAFSIRIAESKAEKSRKQERQARGAFGPTITAQSSYSRFDSAINSSGGSGNGSSFSGDTKSASISLVQPIDISGLSRKALQATEFNRKAAEAGLGVEANSLKLTVRTAYYNVLLAQALVQVQEEALTATKSRYEKAIIREREGLIPRFDVLRFENDVRKTEQALTQAKGVLENAKHGFNSALSRPIETPVELQPVDVLPEIPAEVADMVVAAIQNRPEIMQSQYTISSLNRQASIQGIGLAPQLQIQATHTRYLDPSQNQTSHSTQGALVLSLPLFDSGITRSKVDAARRDEDQARIGLEQLLLGIALEVRNAHTSTLTAKKTYEVALDSRKLAKESLRLAEVRYFEGAGILIDVTQAQADYTAADGNVQNAKYQLLNAYSNILKAIAQDSLKPKEGN